MPTFDKFAVQYSLIPRLSTEDVAVLFAAALDQWHSKKNLKVPPLTFDAPASGHLDGNALFRWAPYVSGDEAIADYSLRHPDSLTPSLTWLTRFSFFAFRETNSASPYISPVRHYLTVQVSLEGPREEINSRTTGRPSIISLLDDFVELSDGDLRFQKKPRHIARGSVGDFIQYTLEDPKRRFPIVVLSEKRNKGYVFDPVLIGKLYFGVCHVYTLGWREALTLSSEVGASRSVFDGAMRVYFPGFRRDKSPSGHPLVPIERLQNPVFRDRLASAIIAETVARFSPITPPRELIDRRVVAYDEARARMAADLKAAVPPSELASYQELLAVYESETEELRSRLNTANNTIDELRKKVAALRHALSQVKGAAISREDSAIDLLLEEEPPVSTLDAVHRAAALTVANLRILPSAYESAEESGYPQPEVVLDYLNKMASIAEQKRQGTLGIALREAFANVGIDYALKNSENTKGRLRAQYKFRDGDEVFHCEEHLRRGNDPALGLRIYFTSDSRDGKFVIGHIGRHLDSNSTN
jgi:hypothetical protein